MKAGKIIIFLTVVACLTGCNRSSENQGGSSDRTVSSQNTDSGDSRATSRNANDGNRTYAANTNETTATAADNTGRNVRDRSDSALTSGDQSNNESDREITRRIRRAITQNAQLSTMAKNIKIITVNGKVTLRGPVANNEELTAITDAAKAAAGSNPIDNQLEVKTSNQ